MSKTTSLLSCSRLQWPKLHGNRQHNMRFNQGSPYDWEGATSFIADYNYIKLVPAGPYLNKKPALIDGHQIFLVGGNSFQILLKNRQKIMPKRMTGQQIRQLNLRGLAAKLKRAISRATAPLKHILVSMNSTRGNSSSALNFSRFRTVIKVCAQVPLAPKIF